MREWITWPTTTRLTTASIRETSSNIMRKRMLVAGPDRHTTVTQGNFSTNRGSASPVPLHPPSMARPTLERKRLRLPVSRPTLSTLISSSMSYKLRFLTSCTAKETSGNSVINITTCKNNIKTSKWTWREWKTTTVPESKKTPLRSTDSLESLTKLSTKTLFRRKSKWDCLTK